MLSIEKVNVFMHTYTQDMKVVMEKKKKAEAEDAEKLERERKLDLLREQVLYSNPLKLRPPLQI